MRLAIRIKEDAILGIMHEADRYHFYPAKVIRVIVSFTPAGATDIFARMVGQKLTEAWVQPVVVDNRRPGAGSTIVRKSHSELHQTVIR